MNYKFRTFAVDENLLSIIQAVTNDPSEVIILYLNECAHSVAQDFFSKKNLPKMLNRTNKFFYKKNETLPVSMALYSRARYAAECGITPEVYITIKFPVNMTHFPVDLLTRLQQENLEKSLGLSESVTALKEFSRPIVKLNKNLRGVI